MFRARESWFRALNRFKTRSFSGKPTATGSSSTNNGNGSEKAESSLTKYDETYRQLDNLDFTAAAKILFTHPPKKRKFGYFKSLLIRFMFCILCCLFRCKCCGLLIVCLFSSAFCRTCFAHADRYSNLMLRVGNRLCNLQLREKLEKRVNLF